MAPDLLALIEPAIATFPDRTALVTPDGQAVAYRKLGATIEAFAGAATSAGLGPGDRVTVEIDNYAVQVCLIIALTRQGIVPVIGSPTAAILAMGLPLAAAITLDMRPSPEPRNILFNQTWFEPAGGPPARAHPRGGGEPALIASSSGTTGERKLMGLSADLLAARSARFDHFYGTAHPNRLITLGSATLYGFTLMLRTLIHGGMVVQQASSPRATLELVNARRIDEISTTPGILVDLVRSQMSSRLALPTLKQITLGGSALSLAAMRDAQAWLCPNVIMSYGATEIGPVAAATADRLAALPPGAVGLLGPGVEVATLDADGRELPAGTAGRLRFTVPRDLRVDGYIHADARSQEAFAGGSLCPGDEGRVTAEGALVIAGRTSELINVGGTKMSPERIEALVADVEGLLQASAVGVRGEQGFDDVCIAAVCRPGTDAERLRRDLVARLGPTAPLRLAVVDELPVNAGGKVDRARVRALFAPAGA